MTKVMVTGAEQGLGLALIRHLMLLGLEAHSLESKFMEKGNRFFIQNGIQSWVDKHGLPDMVVNNYGINHLSWIGDTPQEDENILLTNVMGPYWVVDCLVKMGAKCRVVNVASQTYRVAQRTTSLYCASKAALVQMTKVMARELAPKGWVVNAIAPGKMVDTMMSKLTDGQVIELRGWTVGSADDYARNNIPMSRHTSTDEVAQAIADMLFLPEYINGTVIDMTGGQ